ncbi:MAG: ExbD/TolR family protein [Planctomycetota bacterium]|jgi:biopolymer transport protein ExbD
MAHKLMEEVEEEAEMNMTPMIDVVFLLIIFFLCIDFKILEAKLPAYLPKDRGSQTTETEPVEQLSLKIICDSWGEQELRRPKLGPTTKKGFPAAFVLKNHMVHWMVGPRRINDDKVLITELKKIADDPSRRVTDPITGEKKIMTVVIEPGAKTTYGDVAKTVDMVTVAGFVEINFGGGQAAK